MKTETLKKIVELADGFDVCKPDGFYSFKLTDKSLVPGHSHIFIDDKSLLDHSSYYPLLLRRAVEGWNQKNGPYLIQILTDNVECFGGNGFRIINNYFDFPKTDYLTPQEQAIEACLIELLEN